jgi:hypothetical protein
MMIAALSDDEKYRIVWFKDAGLAFASSEYQVKMNKGQAFSLVSYDSTYLWAVGRAVDGSSNEQAFHHLKLRRSDGFINSAFYK